MAGERPDRVRRNTADDVNADLDRAARQRVEDAARLGPASIDARISALRQEWDMERVLEFNASVLALTGTVLAARHSRRWLYLPATVLSFLWLHAVQGWCPPVPAFRRMGVRTRQEIAREVYALKAVRGDFAPVAEAEASAKGRVAWEVSRP
jgi:hypothetical protein